VGLLRNRSLAAIVVAETVSLTGSSMTYVALPWFVLVTTGSTAKMGWVLAAELLPTAALGILAGSAVGRLGAKLTMNISDGARAPLMAVIPILFWTGHLSFAAVLGATFLVGCFQAPYFTAARLVLPEVVGDDETLVAQGSAFVQGATQITQLAGPVLGGVLIALIGAPQVLLIDGATYLFSLAVILVLVARSKRVPVDESSRGIFAGLRYVVRDRILGPSLYAAAGMNMVVQGLIITLPVLVVRRYDHDAKIFGFLLGGFGVGALVGSVVAAHVVKKIPLLRLAALSIVGMAAPLWLLLVTMPWYGVLFVLGAFGFFAPLVNAPMIGILTTRPPESLRPKVMSAVMTLASIAGPIGFVAAGQALKYVGLPTMFAIVAAGFTVGALLFAAAIRRGEAAAAAEMALPAVP
jgi:MFS family permease